MQQFPLVRAMLAQVYNNTFMCTHPKHVDLTADDINLDHWVNAVPCPPPSAMSKFELAGAEALLEQQPELAAQLWDGRSDDQCHPMLVLVANAYCEHLGII